MSKVTIAIQTVSTALPTGAAAPGLLQIVLQNKQTGEVQSQDVVGVVAIFTGVVDGDYTASAVRLDVNGLPIGDAVSQDFTIATPAPVVADPAPVAADPAPTQVVVTYDAPSALSVTVEIE